MSVPPIRRVVTGHDDGGRAVVIDDATFEPVPTPAGTSALTLLWSTPSSPVDNDDATDGRDRQVGLTLPGGSVLRFVDMLPGTRAPMHRTDSLDYGIVISGSIELVLDDGASTPLSPGDVIVQRGTIHSWYNPSADVTARVAFVLLDATSATVDGEPLPAILPGGARH